MNRIGILITAYKQWSQTKDRLHELQQMPFLKDAVYCVVTNSPTPDDFNCILPLVNVLVKYPNCPGSENSNFISKSNLPDLREGQANKSHLVKMDWRNRYVAAAILYSMEYGLKNLELHGCKYVLQIHSDTTWKSEDQLKKDIAVLEEHNGILVADLCAPFEDNAKLPYGMQFGGEGIVFNLSRCKELGYWNFKKIFETPNSHNQYLDENQFHCYDWLGVEPILGCWAHWLLYKENIIDRRKFVPYEYRQQMICRYERDIHGDFPHMYSPKGLQ